MKAINVRFQWAGKERTTQTESTIQAYAIAKMLSNLPSNNEHKAVIFWLDSNNDDFTYVVSPKVMEKVTAERNFQAKKEELKNQILRAFKYERISSFRASKLPKRPTKLDLAVREIIESLRK